MKKYLFVALASVLLLASCQGKKTEQEPVKPVPEKTPEVIKPAEPVEAVETSTSVIKENPLYTTITAEMIEEKMVFPLTDNFEKVMGPDLCYNPLPKTYILGFSEDSKIAWCDDRYIDGKGSYEMKLYIQDLVSDDILETLFYEQESAPENASLAKDFVENQKEQILAVLNKYKIQNVKVAFDHFPAKIGQNTFNAAVEVKDTGKLLYDFIKVVDYTCKIEKAGAGKKTVTSKKDCQLENAIVTGFVKSPFEDRIAVFIAEAAFGFEGCDIYYNVSGCDLNRNF